MQVSDKLIAALKLEEGIKDGDTVKPGLQPYLCPAGVLTIGYGHTGKDVCPGLTWTLEEAEDLLREDIFRFERGVEALITEPLSQNQFDALVSLTFNIGLGDKGGPMDFYDSTLRRLLNKGDYMGAAGEFEKWCRVNGQPSAGLKARRLREKRMFLFGEYRTA